MTRKKAKYWVYSRHVMEECPQKLTDLSAAFVDIHPLYGDADPFAQIEQLSD
jgi:hypothetical protein